MRVQRAWRGRHARGLLRSVMRGARHPAKSPPPPPQAQTTGAAAAAAASAVAPVPRATAGASRDLAPSRPTSRNLAQSRAISPARASPSRPLGKKVSFGRAASPALGGAADADAATAAAAAGRGGLASAPPAADDFFEFASSEFSPGERVSHPTHGLGTVRQSMSRTLITRTLALALTLTVTRTQTRTRARALARALALAVSRCARS